MKKIAIKKRNVAGDEMPRRSNQNGIKESPVPNEKSVVDKDYQHGGETDLDAFDRALAKASENRRRVKEIQVREKKAQPKIQEGQYIAITTDAQLESNIESKYGRNDRITVPFEIFLGEDYQESILLTEKFWASGSESSRYCQILSKLLQHDARRGFNVKDLIGVACEVIIVHNETLNGTYANIADVEAINMEED